MIKAFAWIFFISFAIASWTPGHFNPQEFIFFGIASLFFALMAIEARIL